MARTSTRRWKGCMLCKPHKFAGNGDSYRQPVQVQREMGSDSRWNRHDLPDEEDRTPRRRRKKDTRRWCRGKVGVEHQPVIVRDHWGWTADQECGLRDWVVGRDPDWFCFHREVCDNCGKVLRHKLSDEECPIWREQSAA